MTNFDDSIFDSGNDDDILNLNSSKNEKQSHQGALNDLIKSALSRDDLQKILGDGIKVPHAVDIFGALTVIFSSTLTSNANMDMMRAVASYLDETTEGEISRRYIIYNLERFIVLSMVAMRYANLFHQKIAEVSEPNEACKKFSRYIQIYADIMNYSMVDFIEDYKDKCNIFGITAKQSLIERQVFDYADLILAKTLSINVYDHHYQFGDLTGFGISSSATIEKIADLLVLAIQSDTFNHLEIHAVPQ